MDERAAGWNTCRGVRRHHWRVDVDGEPCLFATYDRFGKRHSLDSLTAAYAGASGRPNGLEFVLSPVPTRAGRRWCRWRRGRSLHPLGRRSGGRRGALGDAETAAANIADLARLHAVDLPAGVLSWSPVVGPDADRLAGRVATAWTTGPYGEPARHAITGRLSAIEEWAGRYLALAEAAAGRRWVVTHGEPTPATS